MKKIFLGCLILLLTGCYDYKDLNTISLVTATYVDYYKDNYVITAEVINPQAPDKEVVIQAPFIIYSGTGKTIQEAYRNIAMNTSRFLYSNHLQLMLLSKNITSKNLEEIIDFYSRNPSIRTEFYVLTVINDDPLSIITPIDEFSSSSIVDTVNTNKKYLGTTKAFTFNDLLNSYLNPNIEISIPAIKIINNTVDKDSLSNTNEPKVKTMYEINGMGVFKDNNLVGYLDYDETITFNYLNNDIDNSIITYKCGDDRYATLEVVDNKTSINFLNNTFNISFKISSNINDSSCNINYSKNYELSKFKNDVTNYFNNYIENNIRNIIKKYDSDIFGFLDFIYKYNYDEYLKYKDNFNLNNIKFKINSNIDIVSNGNIIGGLNEKDK